MWTILKSFLHQNVSCGICNLSIYLLYSYQKHFDDVKGEVSLPQHISEVELIDARSLGKMIYIFSARKNI